MRGKVMKRFHYYSPLTTIDEFLKMIGEKTVR